jgi:hypothetical protein
MVQNFTSLMRFEICRVQVQRLPPFKVLNLEAKVLIRNPASIILSNRVLEKIDKKASKDKRSRSEYVKLHFETLFFAKQEIEN